MRKPAITLGGAVLAIWGGVQVYAVSAGAYADGADFNAYLFDLARRAMSGLPIGILVLIAGLLLVVWGQFGDRIRLALGFKAVDSSTATSKSSHASQDIVPLPSIATTNDLLKAYPELAEIIKGATKNIELSRKVDSVIQKMVEITRTQIATVKGDMEGINGNIQALAKELGTFRLTAEGEMVRLNRVEDTANRLLKAMCARSVEILASTMIERIGRFGDEKAIEEFFKGDEEAYLNEGERFAMEVSEASRNWPHRGWLPYEVTIEAASQEARKALAEIGEASRQRGRDPARCYGQSASS